jgi:glycosyltransferase involved in cell wall biosynthesis
VHVGLNLVYLVPGETGGMETYARELLPALLSERPGLRLTAFINREAAEAKEGPWHELVPVVIVPVRARRRVEWVRGEQQLLPRLASRAGVDLLHSLASTAPAWGSFRRVVTIQDLIYRVYPEAHFGLRSAAMRLLVPLAARRSRRIIVPSRNTRDDLIRLLRISPEKIDVVPLGVGTSITRNPASENALRARYALGDRAVVLTTGAKRPHKNVLRLLDAVALIPPDRRPVLVLTGYPTPHEQELRAHAAHLGVEHDARFLHWVSPEELEGLYGLAHCLVFPSLYEGFGLPVLEAMARGVAVACSDRGSLAEVAGGAARLFDPESPHAIAEAIGELLFDHPEAERLRAAGLERARQFSWTTTAHATLESYERALVTD